MFTQKTRSNDNVMPNVKWD